MTARFNCGAISYRYLTARYISSQDGFTGEKFAQPHRQFCRQAYWRRLPGRPEGIDPPLPEIARRSDALLERGLKNRLRTPNRRVNRRLSTAARVSRLTG